MCLETRIKLIDCPAVYKLLTIRGFCRRFSTSKSCLISNVQRNVARNIFFIVNKTSFRLEHFIFKLEWALVYTFKANKFHPTLVLDYSNTQSFDQSTSKSIKLLIH